MEEINIEVSDTESTTSVEDMNENEERKNNNNNNNEINNDLINNANQLKEEGNQYLKELKYIDAIEKYSQAIEIYPSPIYYSNRALANLKIENFGLAISDANESIRLDKTYLKAYYRRGSAQFALGKYKKALKDFKYILKKKPKDQSAKAKMKKCKEEIRREAFAEAIAGDYAPPPSQSIDWKTIEVEESYDGPRLPDDFLPLENEEENKDNDDHDPMIIDDDSDIFISNIDINFYNQLIEYFKDQKVLHRKYCIQILIKIIKQLKKTPTLLRLSVPEDNANYFNVCGDTHGQFFDVLNIFELGGQPSNTNPYLFNGDFVDRGSFGVEVALTLFTLKLIYPNGLFLLRGNHETVNMNKIYGFEGEVLHKYDANIMELFTEAFRLLPLSAVISDKVFIVHGGLPASDNVSLDDINKVDRNREPPQEGLMSDLLWSDPQIFPGRAPSKRGVGFSYGPDITNAFLEYNNLDFMVRSHEVKDEGYVVEHDGKCITIFSAPNYCDQVGNKGAFIRLNNELKPNFIKYTAVPHPPIPPMAYARSLNTMGL